jgi:hypothetical protein
VTSTNTPVSGNVPGRPRRVGLLVAVALTFGIATGAISFLVGSVAFPSPARATTDELRQHGAEVYVKFCEWPKGEPRFWPECIGDQPDWEARGADRLVAFCTAPVPSRRFSSADCLSAKQSWVVLTRGPRVADVLLGGVVALAAFAVLFLVTSRYRALAPPASVGR